MRVVVEKIINESFTEKDFGNFNLRENIIYMSQSSVQSCVSTQAKVFIPNASNEHVLNKQKIIQVLHSFFQVFN